MKRFLCIINAIICILLCGCSQKYQEISDTTSTVASESASKAIKEVINLDDADIIIPSMLVGDEIQDVDAVVMDEVSTNEGGEKEEQVIISLSGADRAQLVNGIAISIEESINEILADQDRYPDVLDICPNEDCTVFTISLNGSDMNIYESMLAVSFYTIGNKYQIYAGVPMEDAFTTVRYVNYNTGEVIAEADSSALDVNP